MSNKSTKQSTWKILTVEKSQLALDALAKLTRQFAKKPEFQQLIHTVLFTLSGQLSVSSAFSIFKLPESINSKTVFLGTGKFITDKQLASLVLTPEFCNYLIANPNPVFVNNIDDQSACKTYKNIMAECGVQLIAPVVHSENLLGIIGLGSKVTTKNYGKDELDLLETLINTITPLISNSYQFMEVQKLGDWYVDILNNVKQGVFAFGSNNCLKKINSAGICILKHHYPEIEETNSLLNNSIEFVFPEEIFENLAQLFIKLITENNSRSLNSYSIGDGENKRIYDIYLKRVSGDSEYDTDYIITLDDITKRYKAERKAELTQFAIENAVDGALWITHEGRIRYANESAGNMLGYTKKELVQLYSYEINANIKKESWNQIWEDSKTLGLFTKESRMRMKSGVIVPVELTANFINFDGIAYNCIFFRNITERKLTEEKEQARVIRLQKQRVAITEIAAYEMNVNKDYSELATVITRLVSEVLDVERVSIWLFNSKKTNLFCIDEYLQSANDHSSGQVLRIVDYPQYFKALQTDRIIDCKNILDDERTAEFAGSYLPVAGVVSILDGAISVAGEVVGVICSEDTNFPREWQGDEIKFIGEIASQIAAILSNFNRLKAEKHEQALKEKLQHAERVEAIGVLAGGVAHDLNNMLGPLVGYPELLLMKLPDDSPYRKQIEKMGNSAQGAADIIQDLLSLARRGRYEMQPININDVVNQYLESAGYEKKCETNPDVSVTYRLDSELPLINGSSPHLSKVIMNLIVNAIDAMPDGGKLYIETGYKELLQPAGLNTKIPVGKYSVLRVCDTGMGIAKADIRRIFEPYYSKKKMGTSGSGLGLAVVYGIINDHNGGIDILSEVGEGTEFQIYFPVSDEQENKVSEENKKLTGCEVLLIVDDIEEQRDLGSEIMSSLGYKVNTVDSGREAIKFLQNHSVDIVILDMIMESGFDGLDTYLEILRINPNQKAIVVSGYSVTERVDKLLAHGAGSFLKKPYTVKTLGVAVREELDKA
ncbi:MAG: response regulator [candidate division Zixibacteria bacterium]|nr:response regulator [candidate division Zixibacteria bacterium]